MCCVVCLLYVCLFVLWAGTTSSCTFDPVLALAQVCKNDSLQTDLWLHIDAAYGGAYACLPELATKFQGIELADSFCVNWCVPCFFGRLS